MKNLFVTDRLLIRSANEKDLKFIMGLEQEKENNAFVFQGTKEEHLDEIRDKNTFLMIIEDKSSQRLEGFILAGINRKSDVFELRRIVISEKNKGFGKEVISGLMKYCFKELYINRFWLDVFTDNHVGIHLYKQLGMTIDGVLRESHKSGNQYRDQMIFSILRNEFFQ
ncbi:MAG: GNAT family N-acetyltransferase [Dethiosulfatibacter sp.]|nr:GNAT family N-acetyltransferase [Dethiosulfatibacter sp.]